MAELLESAVLRHLLSFGLGALVVQLARRWARGAHVDMRDVSEDDSDDDHKPCEGVRDDYSANEKYKMLLICNMELYKFSSKTEEMKPVKMSAGKAAAQCSHATLGAYRRGVRLCPNAVRNWLRIGQMKITVKVAFICVLTWCLCYAHA